MDVLSLTPPLPDDFIEMCERLFPWNAYLFVQKDDIGVKTAFCTECNKEMNIDINYMRTVTPADRLLYSKRHNDLCECPNCGRTLIYKDRKRGRGKLWEENYLYYFQALPGGDLVLRTFFLHKSFEYQIENVKVEYSEHQRIYYYDGKVYRFRRYPKSGNPYFAFCDWYDPEKAETAFFWMPIQKITTPHPWAGRFYNRFGGGVSYEIDERIYKGDFRYSCLKEFLDCENRYYNSPLFIVAEYLDRFRKSPGLTEKLAKQGFMSFLRDYFYLTARNGLINWNKPDVYSATGLSKGTVRNLIRNKKLSERELFRAQLREVYGLTPKNADYIIAHDAFVNYVIKQWAFKLKKPDSGDINCMIKYFRKQKITHFSDYEDYLAQLEQLNMSIEDNRYPHNFKAAHDALTAEINRRATAKKKAAAKRQQARFKKKYLELKERLSFEDEGFLIRPARGDEELLEESNVLSHCVYSCYRERYRRLETIICVIRKADEPDKPFYTLEINPSLTRIIQCRGKGNCGVTPEVEAFKNKWFDYILNNKEEKTCRKTA